MRFPLLLLNLFNIIPVIYCQFCSRFDNTWEGFVEIARSIEESTGQYGVLCAFEIRGDDCPSPDDYPLGYNIGEANNLILTCDPDLFGYNADSECVINCPGVHFDLRKDASLTLDGFTLAGATNSSIQLQEGATFRMINSNLRDNYAGNDNNGGAIRANKDSNVEIEYSTMTRNEGFLGGAIYTLGNMRILQTVFTDNVARVAGGATANAPLGIVNIRRSSFHGNVAATGGALHLPIFAEVNLISNTFIQNYAIDGGAIYTNARSFIDESVFMDNFAENGGGAINCETASSTSIHRSEFINNRSGNVGPAVHDRINTRIERSGNTACGNAVSQRNSQCDGVLVRLSRRRTRCIPFEATCIAPTSKPSTSPSSVPTMLPSLSPSAAPSDFPSFRPTPTSLPSRAPSVASSQAPSKSLVPSALPSLSPSSQPSLEPSRVPTSSVDPSRSPSSAPSSFPSLSSTPSIHPSESPSQSPSISSAPSGTPSKTPSFTPTITPSRAPTNSASPSSRPSTSSRPSLSLRPTLSAAPSGSPTFFPTDSMRPSEIPTLSPSSSAVPTYSSSSDPSAATSDLSANFINETAASETDSGSAGTHDPRETESTNQEKDNSIQPRIGNIRR